MIMLLTLLLASALALGSGFEDRHRLALNVEGQDVTLNLKRNTHIDPEVPVYVADNGRVTRWLPETPQVFAAYTDPTSDASIIWREGSQGRGASYEGSFRLGGHGYVLQPRSEAMRERREVSGVMRRDVTDVHHVVYKADDVADQEHDVYDYRIPPELAHYVNDSLAAGEGPRPYVMERYCVESLLVLDYPLYKRYMSMHGNHDEAVSAMKYFFTHVYNGMDIRYQNIPDYSVIVRMKAIYITLTSEDSYWTTRSGSMDHGTPFDWTDAYNALDDLEKWLPKAEKMFPEFDQLTLYSGNKLFGSYRDDGSHRGIGGLANIMGICDSKRKVAINHASSLYPSIQTGTHEMGHNLGALHDSKNNDRCDSSDQYIMAISPGTLHQGNYLNPYHFSVCSRTAIREYLLKLQYEKKNCLLNMVDHLDKPTFDHNLQTLPGQRYSVDEQCQQMWGPKSFYCAGDKYLEMCHHMYCWDDEGQKCSYNAETQAAQGTTCGNRKWCEKTKCVYNGAAPEASETCLYGDVRGPFQGLTCEEIAQTHPYQCYTDWRASECCETCPRINNKDRPGCPFGDRHPDSCVKVREEPKRCYDDHMRTETCCGTCEEIKGEEEDCEYGDKSSWCTTMFLGSCYTEKSCCKTCKEKADPNKPDCPWGDELSWCPSIDLPLACYNDGERCCGSCDRYKTGIPGCEYGDKMLGCRPEDCKNPSTAAKCCSTCGAQPLPSDCEGDTASWCPTMPKHDCYVSEKTCCKTCAAYKTGPQGCEYGDQASWCPGFVKDAKSCSGDTKKTCCLSCAKYN